MDLVRIYQPTEQVTVQGLVEVRAKDDFVGAAALRLDILHPFLVALTPVQVCCCSCSKDATRRQGLLATINKLQGLSFADRVFTVMTKNNIFPKLCDALKKLRTQATTF